MPCSLRSRTADANLSTPPSAPLAAAITLPEVAEPLLSRRGRGVFQGAGMSRSLGSALRQARSIRIAPTPSIIE